MANGLRKFVAPEFIFGAGAIDLVGQYAENFGADKVMVVTDPGVMAVGWTEKVVKCLEESGIESIVFSEVTPNPTADEVMKGVDRYHSEGCDVIVAIGGGSPMDCAKGIGIVSTNGHHILTFEGIDNVTVPCPPLICIPTTAGTSADVSQFAIINNERERVKIAIISKAVVPDVALIDPATTVTMDSYLTACTGLDALVHAIEAFVSSAHSPIFDVHALEAIRLIRPNLLNAIASPDDIHFRSILMRASLEAGLAFSNASLGAVHAMAHSLGGYLGLPHGECNAILLDHVMAYNFDAARDRFEKIGEALALDLKGMSLSEKKQAILNDISQLKKQAGISSGLGERGVSLGDIPVLAKKALQDPCLVTNPQPANQRDIEVIYELAL
ncbi:iron-containing alcohol dehydrogenase [Desulfoluna limicola]|uniref:Iron-containing alcohol dehydrogenase n=1 Tax=Desulfoluna limicola TaxID=2810562 RepID=A0ABM7PL21_9BACT|nr:alcohol dehydrogenase-like regulatory protein ErcA [Desulfoluna limicola]BCS98052.1 iron-containing alcohol dehydrogenase [Desulfoluna limicola]